MLKPRTRKAPPTMIRTAKVARVASPASTRTPAKSRIIPGTPIAHFEYRGSKTSILRYLPSTM